MKAFWLFFLLAAAAHGQGYQPSSGGGNCGVNMSCVVGALAATTGTFSGTVIVPKLDVGGPVSGMIGGTAFGDLRISKTTDPQLLLESQSGPAVGTILWGSPDGGVGTQITWALKGNTGVAFSSPDAGFDKDITLFDANLDYISFLRDRGSLGPAIEYGAWNFFGWAPLADHNFASVSPYKSTIDVRESAAQTADVFRVWNNAGSTQLFRITAVGGLAAQGGTVAGVLTAGKVDAGTLAVGGGAQINKMDSIAAYIALPMLGLYGQVDVDVIAPGLALGAWCGMSPPPVFPTNISWGCRVQDGGVATLHFYNELGTLSAPDAGTYNIVWMQ